MTKPKNYIRVYEWPDSVFVELILHNTSWGGIFSLKREGQQSISLFTMELVAPASKEEGRPPLMIAFKSGGNPQSIIVPAHLPKLLGFLLDLGVSYPTSIPRRSLIPRDSGPGQKKDYAPYPRFVSDIRWENRYEEAKRFTLRPKLEEWRPEANLKTEKYLGLLSNFEIWPPEFYLDDLWHVTYSSMAVDNIESLYFHALVDKVLDEELILPESSRRAWEAANVERGSFVIPSPEEVEVFRILDERLPLLLPIGQLEEWLRGRT